MGINNFKTNLNVANEKGAELKLGANKDGSIPVFYVLRSWGGNTHYQKVVTDALELYKEDGNKQLAHIFANFVIVGWDNVQYDDDGVNVPYSIENAFKLMSNPEYLDLRTHIDKFSDNKANYRAKEIEKIIKN